MTLRPELHLLPETGVLEAPAGVLLDGETWHVFYQFKPTIESLSRWGHSYSESFPYHWTECDDVLAPQGLETALRAGSVCEVDDAINLYFTSVEDKGASIHLAQVPQLPADCEISDTPDHLDTSVRRVGQIVGSVEGYSALRSPCVVPAVGEQAAQGINWIMLALSGATESPVPVVLGSSNGQDWTFTGALEFSGEPNFPVSDKGLPTLVSPRIIRLKDEVSSEIFDILLLTVEGEDASCAENSGYLVGHLKGNFFEVRTGFRRLDFGHDFTRPRNTNFTQATLADPTASKFVGQDYSQSLLFGLLNGRGRGDDPREHFSLKEEGWANVLTLPRLVTLQDGVLYQTPPPGLASAIESSDAARMWTGLLEVGTGSQVKVTLLDGSGNPAAVVSHSGAQLSLDRSFTSAFDSIYAQDAPAIAPLHEEDESTLTIVVDGSTIEVFANSGLVAMSSRMYFEGGCSGFSVECEGNAHVVRTFERTGHNG